MAPENLLRRKCGHVSVQQFDPAEDEDRPSPTEDDEESVYESRGLIVVADAD